jgi:hypothetical protein
MFLLGQKIYLAWVKRDEGGTTDSIAFLLFGTSPTPSAPSRVSKVVYLSQSFSVSPAKLYLGGGGAKSHII